MYSGLTITRFSGRIIGAHQKIDRVARKHLGMITPAGTPFPKIGKLLHFEGHNGPDAIKRKSPAKDEPFHFYNPFDDKDTELLDLIDGHFKLLTKALTENNEERAAFEAAWMAHALVDGLTPAHQYPYEKELGELRGGLGRETRNTLKAKFIMPGATKRDQIRNNWKMWGAKGLIVSHGMFEMGVASLIAPLSFSDIVPSEVERQRIVRLGLRGYYQEVAREIAAMGMYDAYIDKGWTPRLAYDVRHKLGPVMINTVTLAWYAALVQAKIVQKP